MGDAFVDINSLFSSNYRVLVVAKAKIQHLRSTNKPETIIIVQLAEKK